MAYKASVPAKTRAYIRFLRRDKGVCSAKLAKKFKISQRTIQRIANESFSGRRYDEKPKKKATKTGRPCKLSSRCVRRMLREVDVLRIKEGSFTSKRLMKVLGISRETVCPRTFRRYLNRDKYFSLTTRRKGLLDKKDCQKRVAFARKIKKNYNNSPAFWTEKVAFYLDGVSFVYKRNPYAQATSPKSRIWRKKSEGLKLGCTAKGHKAGTGGKLLKLMVAISYKQGVVLCDEYEKLNGQYFADLVKREFPNAYRRAKKNRTRLWVQDNDPSQNSAAARAALRKIKSKQLTIPARSPDINVIENFFHLVRRQMERDALSMSIEKENYAEFSARVKRTIESIPHSVIDKTIESLPKRIDMLIKMKGQRLKY